jgi:hypothetical protein
MTDAMKAMNPKKENTKFNPPNFIGNENPEFSRPSPSNPPEQPPQQQQQQQQPFITLPPTGGGGGPGHGAPRRSRQ